jgi:protein TonB
VHLKFTVTAEGNIKDIVILNKDKLGYGCEEAAMAVIRKMPRWTPGRQNGAPVPVYFYDTNSLPFILSFRHYATL